MDPIGVCAPSRMTVMDIHKNGGQSPPFFKLKPHTSQRMPQGMSNLIAFTNACSRPAHG
jgi:hypothetical protein